MCGRCLWTQARFAIRSQARLLVEQASSPLCSSLGQTPGRLTSLPTCGDSSPQSRARRQSAANALLHSPPVYHALPAEDATNVAIVTTAGVEPPSMFHDS